MTTFRTRFLQDMQRNGFQPKTQSCGVGAVCGLARYHSKCDLVTEEELRRHFLLLTWRKN